MLGSYMGEVSEVGDVGEDDFQKSPGASWCWYWGWEFWSLFLRLRRTTKKAMTPIMMSATTPPTTPVLPNFPPAEHKKAKRRRYLPPTIAPTLGPDDTLLPTEPVAFGPFDVVIVLSFLGSASGSPAREVRTSNGRDPRARLTSDRFGSIVGVCSAGQRLHQTSA